jgi:hypothetical protein
MAINRRKFLKTVAAGSAGMMASSLAFPASSYSRVLGANGRIRVVIVGFSSRARESLPSAFLNYSPELNFEITSLSGLWNRQRDEGTVFLLEKTRG